jgi:integrase
VPALKTTEGNRRPFTMGELKAILKAASVEWRGMVLFGLYTGQRLKDIAGLTWQNVDMERKEVRLTTSKTGRRQVIPLAAPLLAYLAELPASDDPAAPLFPGAFPLAMRSGGTSVLSQNFHDLLVSAGLAVARPTKHRATGIGRDGRRAQSEITFHSLRHTATSLLKMAGASEAVARDIIGHESAEISRHYTHTDEAAKRKALANLAKLTKGL